MNVTIQQCPQVLLRAAQLVLVLGIAPVQVQDLSLGVVEFHEVCTGPTLKPVQVLLDSIPSNR